MIRFTLNCTAGHTFEGWFASSDAFERQQKDGSLACPGCGDTDVQKALMAPAVATSRGRDRAAAGAPARPAPELAVMLGKLREHLIAGAEYVGPRFAEEARKIHYDEAEKRGIYGEASLEEARGLAEEGIGFQPLPMRPEDHN